MTHENPVLADVIRSGFAESRHRGAIVITGPDGSVLHQAGAVDVPIFPRSSNKPMQAVAMVSSGLELEGELLALAAASHAGEDFHVAGAQKILAGAGLTEDALHCPPDLPGDEDAANAVICAGGQRRRLYMNCSGKHAAMLATCVAAGWDTATYTDPGHPLQVEVKRTIERLTGEQITVPPGVDACGAPVFAVSLTGLARAFGALVTAEPGSRERKVADAMRANPRWTSGSKRPDREVVEAVPGLLLKSGAEGVQGFALADGRAVAIKVDDGDAARRVRIPATIAALRALGVDADVPDELGRPLLYGGGRVVGEVRISLPF
jgi:L-asparaginase II